MTVKNWKTTLAGVATALFAFILFSPETFSRWPWLVAIAKFATAGGIAGIGIAAKDNNVTGK